MDWKEGLVLKSAWMISLVLDLMVGLDGELVEQLLSSSVSDLLLLRKRVLRLESDCGGLEVCVKVGFELAVQSLPPVLTRRMRSLEESTLGCLSDGFLFSEETLDGGLLSLEVWFPLSPSLLSL